MCAPLSFFLSPGHSVTLVAQRLGVVVIRSDLVMPLELRALSASPSASPVLPLTVPFWLLLKGPYSSLGGCGGPG